MLTGHSFNQIICNEGFQERLCLVFIDECDLVEEQGAGFRPCYRSIGELRARLPASVPWIAVSATLLKESSDSVMKSLGFHRSRYIRTSLPIDNPNICYIPRFQSYPTSGSAFLDLAWLIPPTIKSVNNITKTLIFCETIALGSRVYKFLKKLLPQSLSSSEVILPYHSLISDEGRSYAMERFKSGETRVIVATDCFTWGVDIVDIRNVVVFGLPSSFSKLVQQIGRAGRDKEQAYAIVYAPSWVWDIPDELLKGKKREASDLERRQNMCQILRQWFNPTETQCPRDVLCLNLGDKSVHPQNCCILHYESLPSMDPEESVVTAFTPPRSKAPSLRHPDNYPPFTKKQDTPILLSISRIISAWVERTWAKEFSSSTLLPPTSFLSQALQDRLRDKFHTMSCLKNLCIVLADWPYLEKYKVDLFDFCQYALKEADKQRQEFRKEAEKREKAEEKQGEILIRLPGMLPPSPQLGVKRGGGGNQLVEERPKKRVCGESS